MSSDREETVLFNSALGWYIFLPEFLEVSISGLLAFTRIDNQLEKKWTGWVGWSSCPDFGCVFHLLPSALVALIFHQRYGLPGSWPICPCVLTPRLRDPYRKGLCVINLYVLATCLSTQHTARRHARPAELKESKCESCPDRRNFLEPFQGERVKGETEGQNTGKWKGDKREYPPDSRQW